MVSGPRPSGSMVETPITSVSSSTNLEMWSSWATTTSSLAESLSRAASSFLMA
ncbi:MAG: hypothetical protein JRN42_06015 [Nitrososphaerota archaeon]|nr:hypothetical protein [Nitrososphaerota archaeon]